MRAFQWRTPATGVSVRALSYKLPAARGRRVVLDGLDLL